VLKIAQTTSKVAKIISSKSYFMIT